MRASRAFRYLWRINAITILTVTVLLILIFSVLLWDLSGDLFGSRTRRNTVQVAEHLIDTAEFSLGDFETIEGVPVLRAKLLSAQDYAGKFSSGTSTAVRNFLFYDHDGHAAHWLVATDDQLFSWHTEVANPATPSGDRTVVGLLYQVVTEDTDGDSRLTAADMSDLALSDPTGHNYEILLTDIEERKGYKQIGDGRFVFFFRRDGKLRVAEIDTIGRTLDRDVELLPTPE